LPGWAGSLLFTGGLGTPWSVKASREEFLRDREMSVFIASGAAIVVWGGSSGTGSVCVVCVCSDVGGLGAPLSAQAIVWCLVFGVWCLCFSLDGLVLYCMEGGM
jgi:hypothetical protein